MQQLYEMKITATAEVRDKDGNLKSSEPVETRLQLSESEVRMLLGENE